MKLPFIDSTSGTPPKRQRTAAPASWSAVDRYRFSFQLSLSLAILSSIAAHAALTDISHSVILTPPQLTAVEQQAVTMLIEEVEKRSQIRWERVTAWPQTNAAVIVVGPIAGLKDLAGARLSAMLPTTGTNQAEGFHIAI